MTTTVRYVAPLLWQGTAKQDTIRQAAPVVWAGNLKQDMIRQAAPVVWTQQKVQAYIRNVAAVQWLVSPSTVQLRKTTALQWTQDILQLQLRRAQALQWTQDALQLKVRSVNSVAWIHNPVSGQVRQTRNYTLQQSAPSGQVRQARAYTIQLNRKVPTVGGLAGLWPLIVSDANITLAQTTLSVSAPVADTSQLNCNTYVTVAPIGTLLNSYSGTTKLYYNRTAIANAFNGSNSVWKLGTIAAATTIRALIPQINTAYSLALDPTDVVDGPVAAGATSLLLTTATNSYVYAPGTSVWVQTTVALSTAVATTNLPGFASAHGNLQDPSLSSVIYNTNLPGFAGLAAGSVNPGGYADIVLADAPYAYYRLTESSGTAAYDLSGNNFNGSYVGGMTLNSAAISTNVNQKYANFPGVSTAYVDVSAAKNFCAGTAWTVEAWVNPTALTPKGGYSGAPGGVTVVGDTGDTGTTSPATGLECSMLSTGMYYWPKDNVQIGPITGNGILTVGIPAHVAWVFNNGTLYSYVNGVLLNTSTGVTNATIRSFLRLGSSSWVGGSMYGQMGEVALYNKALTQAQLQNHFNTYNVNAPVGQQNYMVPGTYNLVVPAGVYALSGVGIGGGGGGWAHASSATWGTPGAGAGLGWKNNIPVTPGETLTVNVGVLGASTTSTSGGRGVVGGTTSLMRGSTVLFSGLGGNPGGNTGSVSLTIAGGSYTGDGGGVGGNSTLSYWQYAAGGGGAAGYTGTGGSGGGYSSTGGAGAGGGAGGGTGSAQTGSVQMNGGAGGGTGLYGLGASGAASPAPNVQQDGFPGSQFPGSGMFGGGASNGWTSSSVNDPAQPGGLRVIWGQNRAYPSTLTTDQNYDPVQGGPADILAHFEGTIKSGSGFDQCGNQNAAIYNNAAFVTTAAAFGTQSVSLAGTTDCIYFNPRGWYDFMVTSDFTFDIFLSKKAGATLSAAQGILNDRQPGGGYGAPYGGAAVNTMASMYIWMDATGNLMANIFGQTNVNLNYNLWNDIAGSGAFSHVAIQVKGLVLQVFVAGVLKASYTGTTRAPATFTPQINVGNSNTLAAPLTTCYIDEVRFINGLARYSASGFKAPTAAFWMG